MTDALVVSLTVEQLEELVERAAAKAVAALVPTDKLNTEDAARLLSLHPKVLERKARDGGVPAERLGREWRFDRRELLEWLRKQPKKWTPKRKAKP